MFYLKVKKMGITFQPDPDPTNILPAIVTLNCSLVDDMNTPMKDSRGKVRMFAITVAQGDFEPVDFISYMYTIVARALNDNGVTGIVRNSEEISTSADGFSLIKLDKSVVTQLAAGMWVTGAGINEKYQIVAILNDTEIRLRNNVYLNFVGNATSYKLNINCKYVIDSTTVELLTNPSYQYPVPSDLNIEDLVGLSVSGPGIPYGTTVIGGTTDSSEVSGVSEVTSITCTPENSGLLSGKYFIIYDINGSVGVWFSHPYLSGGSPAPMPAGASACNRQIEISNLTAFDSATVVAQKVAAILDSDAKFTASNVNEVVSVHDIEAGIRTDASDGNTGFTFVVTTQGTSSTSVGAVCYLNQKTYSASSTGTGEAESKVLTFSEYNKGYYITKTSSVGITAFNSDYKDLNITCGSAGVLPDKSHPELATISDVMDTNVIKLSIPAELSATQANFYLTGDVAFNFSYIGYSIVDEINIDEIFYAMTAFSAFN
jgi:hypothetical protein